MNKANAKNVKSFLEVYPNFPSHVAKIAPKTRGWSKFYEIYFILLKIPRYAESLEGIGRLRSVDPAWSLLTVTLNLKKGPDICPWTLSVPRSPKFSSNFALGELFASRNS